MKSTFLPISVSIRAKRVFQISVHYVEIPLVDLTKTQRAATEEASTEDACISLCKRSSFYYDNDHFGSSGEVEESSEVTIFLPSYPLVASVKSLMEICSVRGFVTPGNDTCQPDARYRRVMNSSQIVLRVAKLYLRHGNPLCQVDQNSQQHMRRMGLSYVSSLSSANKHKLRYIRVEHMDLSKRMINFQRLGN